MIGTCRAAREVAAAPDLVFDVVTDLAALTRWNAVVVEVTDTPPELVPGAQWVVRCRAKGMSWSSRSTLLELDPAGRRFAHRSGTDDGNPSYADWRWTVRPTGGGCRLQVEWQLHPRTTLRRLVLAPVRARMLRREVAVSLDALAQLVAARQAER